MVLSDNALPEEFRLALAEKLQQGIFSSVSRNRCSLAYLEMTFNLIQIRFHSFAKFQNASELLLRQRYYLFKIKSIVITYFSNCIYKCFAPFSF